MKQQRSTKRKPTISEEAYIRNHPQIEVKALAIMMNTSITTAWRIKNELLDEPQQGYSMQRKISARGKKIQEKTPKIERPPAVYSNQKSLYNL